MHHHTAVLFNKALSASQALMGALSARLLDQNYLCSSYLWEFVSFYGALSASPSCTCSCTAIYGALSASQVVYQYCLIQLFIDTNRIR